MFASQQGILAWKPAEFWKEHCMLDLWVADYEAPGSAIWDRLCFTEIGMEL